ncbi:MFS multidrug transporter [Astrocystis sublimbata]|nr:MFS multidrug transporter [Astrocystis sublimbata]
MASSNKDQTPTLDVALTPSHDSESKDGQTGNNNNINTGIARKDSKTSSDDHKEKTSEDDPDPYLVTWEGRDDPANPYNWPSWMKWLVTLLVSFGGLVTLMSATMIAPALTTISGDLHVNDATTQLTLSIFVLGYAIGPMVLAPLSEVFGRKIIWLTSGAFYVLWNTICGIARSNGLLVVSRLLAGLGASAQYATEFPVLGDCWLPDNRGLSFSIVTFLPLLGPAIGPILGGVLTGTIGWPWIFYVLSLFDGALLIASLVFFPETSGQHNNSSYYAAHEKDGKTMSQILAISLARPCRLILTHPHIQLMSFFLALNYGILYIVQSTFAELWIERYGQSVTISGLHYIAIALGSIIAAQVGAKFMDRIWKRLKERHGETQPEYRVPLLVPGAILMPIGLFWYGWTAQTHQHWILPDIGVAIFSCGAIISTQALQAYVMDSYPEYIASATAASQLPRNITAFTFPLFGPQLYKVLGYGWGNSVLAFILIGAGFPAPVIL